MTLSACTALVVGVTGAGGIQAPWDLVVGVAAGSAVSGGDLTGGALRGTECAH